MLPPFTPEGELPPGIHPAGWSEIVERFGQTARRRMLLAGLRQALNALRVAGCRTVYIGGSFVTDKPEPGDFDGCWDVRDVDPPLLDPVLLDFASPRTAQKARYGGELFPAEIPEGVSGRSWLDFFQTDRNGRPLGVVAIDLGDLP